MGEFFCSKSLKQSSMSQHVLFLFSSCYTQVLICFLLVSMLLQKRALSASWVSISDWICYYAYRKMTATPKQLMVCDLDHIPRTESVLAWTIPTHSPGAPVTVSWDQRHILRENIQVPCGVTGQISWNAAYARKSSLNYLPLMWKNLNGWF